MSYDPNVISNQLMEKGHDWSDKECAAEMLEETRKTLRSQIAVSNLAECGSVAKAELLAEATNEYIQHVKSMVIARRESNKARVDYDAARVFVDLIRTKEATNRATMGLR